MTVARGTAVWRVAWMSVIKNTMNIFFHYLCSPAYMWILLMQNTSCIGSFIFSCWKWLNKYCLLDGNLRSSYLSWMQHRGGGGLQCSIKPWQREAFLQPKSVQSTLPTARKQVKQPHQLPVGESFDISATGAGVRLGLCGQGCHWLCHLWHVPLGRWWTAFGSGSIPRFSFSRLTNNGKFCLFNNRISGLTQKECCLVT